MGRETGGAPFWGVRLVPHPPAENAVHLPAFAVEVATFQVRMLK